MKLALENRAIVASVFISPPIIVFVAVADTRNGSSLQRERHSLLSSRDLLRPAFNHPHATVDDFLRLRHNDDSSLRRLYPLFVDFGGGRVGIGEADFERRVFYYHDTAYKARDQR